MGVGRKEASRVWHSSKPLESIESTNSRTLGTKGRATMYIRSRVINNIMIH